MLRHSADNSSTKDALAIRGYAPADWPQVCRVHDLARVQELAWGGVDARAFRTMEEAAEADEFFVSETLVACDGETVVGFISWNGSYITWLYVDPAYQRRAIGGRLLREALQQIGPDGWTNMIGGNEPALTLYRKAGMEVVWTRPSDIEGYACNGMRLALPTSRMHDPAARRHGAGL
jgi:ribosomal-protein-alanine N-acetyltransferase